MCSKIPGYFDCEMHQGGSDPVTLILYMARQVARRNRGYGLYRVT